MNVRGRVTLIAAIAGLAGGGALVLVPWLTGDKSPRLGVCLSEPLAFQDRTLTGCLSSDDLGALDTSTVALGDNPDQSGVIMTDPTNVRANKTVRTCAEYEAATKEGWYALTTYDISMESFFKRACALVRALETGTPAKTSHLAKVEEGLGGPDTISASAIAALVPEAKGVTIGDLVRTGAVQVEARTPHAMTLSAQGLKGELTEIARGDFSGDGIEDVLAFFAVRAEGGSMRAYETLVLTRLSPGGPLEVTRAVASG